MRMMHSLRRGVVMPIALAALAVSFLTLSGGCPTTFPPPTSGILYVNAAKASTGNGWSWDSAFASVQQALNVARTYGGVHEIWVAAGTYRPTGTGGERTATFALRNGVAIYGGFAGNETSFDQRDVARNVTILSGDLNRNDVAGEENSASNDENAFRVVTSSGNNETAVLDGFTVSGGYASSLLVPTGAGIFIENGNPTISNCVFRRNGALTTGGGAHLNNANPRFTNCTFEANLALTNGGGMNLVASAPTLANCDFVENSAELGAAMNLDEGSDAMLEQCEFRRNVATLNGGALHLAMASPTLTDCTFVENLADVGGAIYSRDEAAPRLDGCTFRENVAETDGGAITNLNASAPTLTDCLFVENAAIRSGGAIFNTFDSDARIERCRFFANSALSSGGAVFNFISDPTFVNCVLAGNSASLGGAIGNGERSGPLVVNCTLRGNAAITGGAMYNSFEAMPTVTNCILWENSETASLFTPPPIRPEDGATTLTYSCVEGGWEGGGGTGNINADPLFANANGPDGFAGNEDDDYSLVFGSPCVDAGNSAAVPEDVTTDAAGKTRFADSASTPDTGEAGTRGAVVDLGAFEL